MTKLEKAQAYFAQDRFATENGAVIAEVGDGYAVCTMELTSRHRNALGNVMGGAIFTLADFAFAVASNFDKRPMVSTTNQITYLRGIKGDRMTARAEKIREGRTSGYYEVSVTDEMGNLVARMTGYGAVIG